jgi:hypothetical protein
MSKLNRISVLRQFYISLQQITLFETKIYSYYKYEFYILILVRRRKRKECPKCAPSNKRLTPFAVVIYYELGDRGLIPDGGIEFSLCYNFQIGSEAHLASCEG